MKILKPYAYIEDFNNMNVYQKLEKIGRVCYKSENLMKDDSSDIFITNIIRRGHESVIEHHNFTLFITRELYHGILLLNPKYIIMTNTEINGTFRYLISGSARGFKDLLKKTKSPFVQIVVNYIKNIYPNLFLKSETIEVHKEIENFCFINKILTDSELENLTYTERMKHTFISARFVCDRGVSHEIVRHRPCSYSQSSTRYCNYSSNRFGSAISVIDPIFYQKGLKRLVWWTANKVSELCYMILTKWLKSTPQEARSILTNSLMTEIVMTTNLEEWELFFSLRDDKAAHPQMIEVAKSLHNEFIHKKYLIR